MNRGGRKAKVSYTEEDLQNAVLNYAKDGFVTIRRDQASGVYNRDAEILEDYIKDKSDERTLYRGLKMSFADLENIEDGDVISQKGISSWTPSTILSEGFATNQAYDGASVIFVLDNGTKKGADISALKGKGRSRERETLISKTAKQKVLSKEWINDICYIKVEEV